MSFMNCALNMTINVGDFFDRFTRKNNSGKKHTKKAAREYQPFATPEGLNIQGPLADHLRTMYGMAEAFEPGAYDRVAKASRPAATVVQTAPNLSAAEMDAIVNAGNNSREPETGKTGSDDQKSEGDEPSDDDQGGDSSQNVENIITAIREVAGEELQDRSDAGQVIRPRHRSSNRRSNRRIPA